MKILHIVLCLGKGGAEKLLVDFLPKYTLKGHNISILQLSSILESQEYIDLVEKAGIKFYSLSNGRLKNPFLILKIRKFLKENNFDIVHVHLFPSLYFSALATIGIKNKPVLVFTEHSSQNGRNTRFYFKPIEMFMYARYDAIIAISDNIKSKLISWVGLQKNIYSIPNGIDIHHFEGITGYSSSEWIQMFDVPFDSFKILMVARFSHPKDHLTVLRAIQQLPPKVHLFLVGDGGEVEKIKRFSQEMNLGEKVHFLGFRLDIPQLMKTVDIVVLSSLYEGMSGVTMEALASKTVFLGSDVSGIKEVVPDNRFLFSSQDYKMLAEKINSIKNNTVLMTSMQKDGFSFVQKFDVSNMIDQHLSLYEKLLNQKNRK
ncbi:MAG: hypothetical protein CML19_10020 [Pusillimonas sp.]|nr:hypothetical protein [Pusillimonas sp.]|tara:strand:- start:42125 stop:43243 length:1119 start_codon:yes stop_codon:yes gene_type:complete